VHGLPPGKGQLPDISTPCDNRLLGRIAGCDGLKTGYFRAAGFSIAATASRRDQRVIAIVLGASNGRVRDAKAKEMLTKGLRELAMSAPPPASL